MSPEPYRKDLDDMTPEEIHDYFVQQREEALKRYAGNPLPRISRVKREDYPHWEQTGWSFRVQSGSAALVTTADGTRRRATIRGLHHAEDQGPLVLLVDVGEETWAMRRNDAGAVWADRVPANWCETKELDVPVAGWPLPGAYVGTPGAMVPAPPPGAALQRCVIRTSMLEED